MIAASLRLVVPEKRKAEVLKSLRSLLGPTSAQAGCAGCGIYRDALDDRVWSKREQGLEMRPTTLWS